MDRLLKEFSAEFRDRMLLHLWRQWSALGVAGHARIEDSRIIDPEALLLVTCTLGRHDPRLFDEVIDWLRVNGSLINILRLKRIQSTETFSGGRVLATIAGLMSKGSDVQKWTSLAASARSIQPAEALFFARDDKSLPSPAHGDPHFARYGFHRGPLRSRGHSQIFRPTEPANLVLQMRALFGINVRCEIVAYLLTHQAAHPSRLARETCYFVRAVQNTLVDMSRSGIVQMRSLGREKHYWLDPEPWAALLHRSGQSPKWVTWPPLFSALERIWLKLDDPPLMKFDPLLQSSELRHLMVEVRPLIERAGFAHVLSDDRQHLGEHYLPVFINDMIKLLDQVS